MMSKYKQNIYESKLILKIILKANTLKATFMSWSISRMHCVRGHRISHNLLYGISIKIIHDIYKEKGHAKLMFIFKRMKHIEKETYKK